MRTIDTILVVLAVVAAALLVLVLFFFTVRVRASIIYNEKKGFQVKISILSIKVFGTGEKKPARVRVSDYKIGRPKKKRKDKGKPAEEARKPVKITEIINTIRVIISTFFDRYAKFLNVRAVRLNISVATGDAATTALLYSAVIQGTAYILALLEQLANLKSLRHSEVRIIPDYTKETTRADIKIVLTLPVWCALGLLIKTGVLGKDGKEAQ